MPVVPEPVEPGRTRRDPRAARGGLRREAPTVEEASAAPVSMQAVEVAAPRVTHRILENPEGWILVVSPAPEPWSGAEAELLGLARRLAGERDGVVLLRLGAGGPTGAAGPMGADRLIEAGDGAGAVMAALAALPARHILFPESFASGDLARRLAARLGERPAIGVLALDRARDGAERIVTRGEGGRRDLFRAPPRIMLIDRNRFAPWEGLAGEARVVPLPQMDPLDALSSGLPLVETIPQPATEIPLALADFIVSAGEGVSDWPAFHQLARDLGAAEAGSRQVCDAGHLPRARQVGASGTLVEARLYLAFGISGAPQHLQGVQKCRHVLAVNTDLHAAMVKRADLAVIADAQQVMPALSRMLAAEKAGGRG